MQNSQPIIVPPMVRIPQVSPQTVTQKRCLCLSAAIQQQSTLQPYSPLPQPYHLHRLVYIPSELSSRTVTLQTRVVGMPTTSHNSLANSSPFSVRRPDLSVAETLVGCAIILCMTLVLLAIVFYFSL